ncbi:hypothetical protein ADU83_11070, partial [Clostridium botulinum]
MLTNNERKQNQLWRGAIENLRPCNQTLGKWYKFTAGLESRTGRLDSEGPCRGTPQHARANQ